MAKFVIPTAAQNILRNWFSTVKYVYVTPKLLFDCLVFICHFKHFSFALPIPIKMFNAIENKTLAIIWHFHQENVKNFHFLLRLRRSVDKLRWMMNFRWEYCSRTAADSNSEFELMLIIARLWHFAYRNINMNYSERLLPFRLWIKFDSNELYIQRLHCILSASRCIAWFVSVAHFQYLLLDCTQFHY